MSSPEPLGAAERARLRALCEAATPGEWQPGRADMQSYDGATGEPFTNIYADDERAGTHQPTGELLPLVIARVEGEAIPRDEERANAEFIAAARTALPRLLDEVERQLKEIVELRTHPDGAPYCQVMHLGSPCMESATAVYCADHDPAKVRS